jgi:hypothetical protein
MTTSALSCLALAGALALAGCSTVAASDAGGSDAEADGIGSSEGGADATLPDGAGSDAGLEAAANQDVATGTEPDGNLADAGPPGTEAGDVGPPEAGPGDTGLADAGLDTGLADVGVSDANIADTSVSDASLLDAVSADGGLPEAMADVGAEASPEAAADVSIDSYVVPPTCLDDGNPHFEFLHNPGGLDYSADIQTGIGAATTPAPGDTFNAKIFVHNQGNVPGNAEVALCICPAGSSVTTFVTCQTLAGQNLDACNPLDLGATSIFLMPWTVPSGYAHFFLAVMVKDTALGAPDYDSPIDAANSRFTVPFDPANARSAEFDVTLTPGGGAP